MTSPLKHILYVDDDSDSCEMMSRWLRMNCTNSVVTTVGSAKEAIAAIRTHAFDIYVFDNFLPDASGVHLCTKIRKNDSFTPIVMFSAVATFDQRDAATRAGADSYLIKPNDLELLPQVVTRLLNRPRPRMPLRKHRHSAASRSIF